MPASILTGDRRSIPTVAIIGNDAVLVAAPATPVQLSHACLRYGFSIAVPATWGDELIAGEALRQLASRTKGPAVMCVCPYARSRLLTPGPDLEPFLVSLASPPVATARYLRAVYGEHGVHITYIGACPGGADPVIDVRLTPTAFLADLADRGIPLSEQPLVFDSIVPPDRRRWCSLPGGVPSAEMLCSDTDTRTLVEIDRDDVSTDLVQHIMTREHVLLDLAPSLGCACSGAIGSLAPHSARGAVAALEPPRAPGPVVDLAVVVSLDVPPAPPTSAPVTGSPPAAREADLLERQLDQLLGVQATDPLSERATEAEFEAELDADLADLLATSRSIPQAPSSAPASSDAGPRRPTSESMAVAAETSAVIASDALGPQSDVGEVGVVATAVSEQDDHPISANRAEPPRRSVRRRTPVSAPPRYSGSSIPKATSTDGRALPRAYVAKRRTPSMGIPTIDESARDESTRDESVPPAADNAPLVDTGIPWSPPVEQHRPPDSSEIAADDTAALATPRPTESHVVDPTPEPQESPTPPRDEPPVAAPESHDEPRTEPNGAPQALQSSQAPQVRDAAVGPGNGGGGGTIAASDSTQSALRILMFAVLLGFAVVVLYTLRP